MRRLGRYSHAVGIRHLWTLTCLTCSVAAAPDLRAQDTAVVPLTEFSVAQCHALIGADAFHCYTAPVGWIVAKTLAHAEIAARDVQRLNADFTRYFAAPAPRIAAVVDTTDISAGVMARLHALGARRVIPWPVSRRFEQLGVMNHELGHLYYFDVFPGPGADWMKETSAILMERVSSTRRRHRTMMGILRSPRHDTLLIPLRTLFAMPHPGSDDKGDATLGVTGGMSITGTLGDDPADSTAGSGPDTAPASQPTPLANTEYTIGTVFYEECRSVADFLIAQSGDSTIFRAISLRAQKGARMDRWLAREGPRYHLPTSIDALDRAWRAWLAQRVSAWADTEPVSAPTRLSVRPQAMATGAQTVRAGMQDVTDSSADRDLLGGALVYVPERCVGRRRCPLVVLLHGSGMDASSMLGVDNAIFQTLTDSLGFILLAVKSESETWGDLFSSDDTTRGQDVRRIDAALRQVLRHYAIDPARIALAGVSDGATYTLLLGYANGDVFSRLVALSPGLNLSGGDSLPLPRHGAPPIFIAKGVNDETLPIAGTRTLVPWLRHAGYAVTYVEDLGTHYLTEERAIAAFHWLATSWRADK